MKTSPDDRRTKELLGISDEWQLVTKDGGGGPALVRINKGVESIKGHPKYGHRLSVSIPFGALEDDGLPTSEENQVLSTVEEIYVHELEKHCESLFVGAITAGNTRKLLFYTAEPGHACDTARRVQRRISSYAAEVDCEPDQQWNAYITMDQA